MIETKIFPPFAWATVAKVAEGWQNQDSWVCVKGNAGVAAALLDGVGGSIDGGKASHLAERFLFQNFNMTDFRKSPDEIADRFQGILQLADQFLKGMTKKGLSPDAGTTVVAAAVRWPDPGQLPICDVITAWGGDSRAYVFMPDNQLLPTTVDNEVGMTLQGWGMINHRLNRTLQPFLSNLNDANELDTEEKRRAFLERNILDVGLWSDPDSSTPQYAVSMVQAPIGSRVILMTDGLTDNLKDIEIQEILSGSKPLEAAKSLVEAAQARSHSAHLRAKPDDISCVEISLDPK
jgi:serine/threonine protein phosphatase PrpC